LALMDKEDVDLMLLDVRLPGISGFEVLKILRENYPFVEVIVISAIKELETAVEAMEHGAYHYVSKDFDYESIRSLVSNASGLQARAGADGTITVRLGRCDARLPRRRNASSASGRASRRVGWSTWRGRSPSCRRPSSSWERAARARSCWRASSIANRDWRQPR